MNCPNLADGKQVTRERASRRIGRVTSIAIEDLQYQSNHNARIDQAIAITVNGKDVANETIIGLPYQLTLNVKTDCPAGAV